MTAASRCGNPHLDLRAAPLVQIVPTRECVGMQIAVPAAPSRTLGEYKRPLLIGLGAAAVIALVMTALPGAYDAVRSGISRLPDAAPSWLLLALGLEALSFLGHIILFRTVFVERSSRVGFAASYEITMAGHAA